MKQLYDEIRLAVEAQENVGQRLELVGLESTEELIAAEDHERTETEHDGDEGDGYSDGDKDDHERRLTLIDGAEQAVQSDGEGKEDDRREQLDPEADPKERLRAAQCLRGRLGISRHDDRIG